MANALYDLGRNAFLTKAIDWVNDTVRVYLIDTDDYTVNLATDQYLDDIAAGAKVANADITSKTASAGVADGADTTLTSVTGDTSEALVIAMWSGVESSSPLIAYIDTATGLPVIPNGGDITITWDNGANKIFKL
jgi:hypothetical protein